MIFIWTSSQATFSRVGAMYIARKDFSCMYVCVCVYIYIYIYIYIYKVMSSVKDG